MAPSWEVEALGVQLQGGDGGGAGCAQGCQELNPGVEYRAFSPRSALLPFIVLGIAALKGLEPGNRRPLLLGSSAFPRGEKP